MSFVNLSKMGAAWFEAVATASLHASLLIGLVLLLQWALRKWLTPGWRHALWLLVVLRLVLPVVPASPLSIFNMFARDAKTPAALPSSIELRPSPILRPVGPVPESTDTAQPLPPAVTLGQTVAWVWLAGIVILLIIVARRYRRVSALVKASVSVRDEEVQSVLADCRGALRVRPAVTLKETESISTPAVFGVRRPCLLLPVALRQRLDGRELRHVFLHELMHVKRRDLLLNWLLFGAQAVHWFNPLVWLAFKRLRADREVACDAAVLRHLNAGERHQYGCTLIKLVEQFTPARLEPGLLAVMNTETEIKRRILMISNFKPTSRIVTYFSALLLLLLGLFTLTRAADKSPTALAAELAMADSGRDRQWVATERGIRAIEEEFAKHKAMVADRQAELDRMKVELGITEQESSGAGDSFGPGTLRRLESLRIEAKADYERRLTLYSLLTNLPYAEFKAAVATTTPDPLLTSLLQQQAEVEQKLAEQAVTFDPKHPGAQATRKVQETIERQINDRLDGILSGLKAQVAAEKKRVESLEEELDRYQARDIELAIRRRPYSRAKRDLETLQLIQDRLQTRLFQEKIDHSANLAAASSVTPEATVNSRRARVVEINADGRYHFGGRTVSIEELAAALKQAQAESPGLALTIRAPAGANFKAVAALLDRCIQLRIDQVSLQTEPQPR